MEEIFTDIEGCEVIVDDILVWGKDDDEHDRRLVQVLEKARKVNRKLCQEKCKFKTRRLVYIGHQLTKEACNQMLRKLLL